VRSAPRIPRARRPSPAVRWSVPSLRARIRGTTVGREMRRRRAGTEERGGDEETRTPDPLLAKEMLYQLSYVPKGPRGSREEWWAFLDSNQRPLPYQGSALTS
jgi:hypothetical protein